MRQLRLLPLAAALILSACGGGAEEAEGGEDGSANQAAAAAAEQMVQPMPGEYRTSVELLEFAIPGMSEDMQKQMRQMAEPDLAQGHTFCLRAEQAERGPREMLQNMAEGNCKFEKFDVSGTSVDTAMRCTGEDGREGGVKMSGEMSAERSNMVMEMEQPLPQAGAVKMKMRMMAERIGECA